MTRLLTSPREAAVDLPPPRPELPAPRRIGDDAARPPLGSGAAAGGATSAAALGQSHHADALVQAGRAAGAAQPGVTLVRWVQQAPVVVLAGDLDISIAGQLADIGRLLRTWSAPRVAHAAEVTFIDAGGLRAVLSLAVPGTAVHLVRPSAPVRRLLQVLTHAQAGLIVVPGEGPAGTLAVTGLPGW